MSYILDALRKSETERRQGRVPDLGQQVQLIHKPRKRSVPVLVWVAIGLVLNAAVLAWIFWPRESSQQAAVAQPEETAPVAEPPAVEQPAAQVEAVEPAPRVRPLDPGGALANAIEIPVPGMGQEEPADAVAESGNVDERERPTVIVPTPRTVSSVNVTEPLEIDEAEATRATAPHLVELPQSFQKTVPDLIFNSHIYASDPSSRRVMINDNYLRVGESFSGITVERITEQGVELSKDGRRFRVGVVRNWTSPD